MAEFALVIVTVYDVGGITRPHSPKSLLCHFVTFCNDPSRSSRVATAVLVAGRMVTLAA